MPHLARLVKYLSQFNDTMDCLDLTNSIAPQPIIQEPAKNDDRLREKASELSYKPRLGHGPQSPTNSYDTTTSMIRFAEYIEVVQSLCQTEACHLL
jgi:hypothetical protein